MAECEFLNGCPFFNDKMKDTEGLGAMYKKKYCLGDNSECARYMVVTELGKGHVTMNLYPNMVDHARKIISDGSK